MERHEFDFLISREHFNTPGYIESRVETELATYWNAHNLIIITNVKVNPSNIGDYLIRINLTFNALTWKKPTN